VRTASGVSVFAEEKSPREGQNTSKGEPTRVDLLPGVNFEFKGGVKGVIECAVGAGVNVVEWKQTGGASTQGVQAVSRKRIQPTPASAGSCRPRSSPRGPRISQQSDHNQE
jgi:hypothetical protein